MKRLLDQGFRPGKLLPLSFEALDSLLADVVDTSVATELRKKSALGTRHSARQRPPKASIGSQNGGGDWVIPLLKSHDTNAARTALIQKIAQHILASAKSGASTTPGQIAQRVRQVRLEALMSLYPQR